MKAGFTAGAAGDGVAGALSVVVVLDAGTGAAGVDGVCTVAGAGVEGTFAGVVAAAAGAGLGYLSKRTSDHDREGCRRRALPLRPCKR